MKLFIFLTVLFFSTCCFGQHVEMLPLYKKDLDKYKKILTLCQDQKNYEGTKHLNFEFDKLTQFEKNAVMLSGFEKLEKEISINNDSMAGYFAYCKANNLKIGELLKIMNELIILEEQVYAKHVSFCEKIITDEKDEKLKKEYSFVLFMLKNKIKNELPK